VLVVRYEDLQAAPAYWLGRISAHLGLNLGADSIDAAMAVCSRDAVRGSLDPAYGEAIVPPTAARARVRFAPADDRALSRQFAAHLQHDFGYGHARRPPAPSAGAVAILARAAFLLTAGYALFDQLGRPSLELSLGGPWGRVELAAEFFFLTLLTPPSFPRLKALAPAILSLAGGGVELAQHSGLAPGIGTVSDVLAEVGGIAAALGLTLLVALATAGWSRPAMISSPAASSEAPAARAPPGRRPG